MERRLAHHPRRRVPEADQPRVQRSDSDPFPSTRCIALSNPQKPRTRIINFVGGTSESLYRILRWTSHSLRGRDIAPSLFAEEKEPYRPLTLTMKLRTSWAFRGRLEIDKHMQQLTTGYLRTDDVRDLLWRLPQIFLLVLTIRLKRQTIHRVTDGIAAAAPQACQDETTEDWLQIYRPGKRTSLGQTTKGRELIVRHQVHRGSPEPGHQQGSFWQGNLATETYLNSVAHWKSYLRSQEMTRTSGTQIRLHPQGGRGDETITNSRKRRTRATLTSVNELPPQREWIAWGIQGELLADIVPELLVRMSF